MTTTITNFKHAKFNVMSSTWIKSKHIHASASIAALCWFTGLSSWLLTFNWRQDNILNLKLYEKISNKQWTRNRTYDLTKSPDRRKTVCLWKSHDALQRQQSALCIMENTKQRMNWVKKTIEDSKGWMVTRAWNSWKNYPVRRNTTDTFDIIGS